ncbi:uncharacterized protein LOC136089258 isoform X2 [Hydra vulgaris]|uniref:Uncharacterized protein LOC136089258 isoform X2 n=1 Tax=Hydra vulgaris TaxID=6087 RepID=A0ABM4D9Z2_HYDVU
MVLRRTFSYSSLLKKVTTVQKEINYCSTKRDEVVFEDKTFCHDSFQNSSLAEIKHCSAKRDEVVFEDETFCYDSFQNFSLAVIPGDGQLYQIKISDEKWKSVIDELTENQKKCFYEKINSPLKCRKKTFNHQSER